MKLIDLDKKAFKLWTKKKPLKTTVSQKTFDAFQTEIPHYKKHLKGQTYVTDFGILTITIRN